VTSLRAARRTLADDVPARRHGAGTLERYVPFDVDRGMVCDTAAALAEEYPGLEVEGITGDFENDLDQIPPPQPGAPRILHVLNRELDADFDAGNFEHVAFYDEAREWIEIRLRAHRAHSCASSSSG
jgi:uncharacterized SAM-dependent methyltransferase